MQNGRFYFIADDFYAKYDAEHCLMQNKEVVNGKPAQRPCFFAFPDSKNPQIFWCVPISSKVDKYQAIYDKKIAKQLDKHIKNPVCNTIRFGEVMGQKRAFLIQNMFPVIKSYVTDVYIDRNTQNAVTIDPHTESDIIKNAKAVLKLSLRGIPIVFGNIKKIYESLTAELTLLEKASPIQASQIPEQLQGQADSTAEQSAAPSAQPKRQESFSLSGAKRKELADALHKAAASTPSAPKPARNKPGQDEPE